MATDEIAPADELNPDRKDKKWIMAQGKAMYKRCYEGGEGILNGRRSRMELARKYHEARQDPDQYKKYFDPEGNPMWVNMSWRIVSPIPKIVDIIVERLMERSEQMTAAAIDPLALDEKQNRDKIMEMEMLLKPYLAEADTMMGVQSQAPETPEELEIIKASSVKEDIEILAEVGMSVLGYDSDMDKSLKRQILIDEIRDGAAGVYDYRDANGRIKCERIDMMNAVVGFSDKADCSDIDKAGYIRKIAFADLKEMAGSEFTKEEYDEIAKQISKDKGYQFGNSSNAQSLPDETIHVFCFAFKSTNRLTYDKLTNKHGGVTVKKEPVGYAPKGETSYGKHEPVNKDIKVYYKGMWIVGTDYIFGAGLGEDMRRTRRPDGSISNEVELPMRFYVLSGQSIVERMIPLEDQYMLAYLKWQNEMARAMPAGVIWDADALAAVTNDGKSFTPLELMGLVLQTGSGLYKKVGDNRGDNGLPFAFNPGSVSKGQEWLLNMENAERRMESISGMNEASAAVSPDPKQSATATSIAAQATAYAIQPLYAGWISLKERTMRNMLNRLQLACKNKDYYGYYYAMGQKLEVAKVTADISLREFAIRIEASANPQQIEAFYLDLREAVANGSITPPERFMVERVMHTSLTYAEKLLEIKIAKRQKEAAQAQSQAVQENTQAQIQSAQAASQMKIQEANELAKIELFKLQKAHEYKMAEIREAAMLPNVGGQNIAHINAQASIAVAEERTEAAENKPKVTKSK